MADDAVDAEVEHPIGCYRVRVGLDFGPRITGLRRDDGSEVFAALDKRLGVTADDGEFSPFRGGHRLWAAPETSIVTYATDNPSCRVDTLQGGLTVVGPVDQGGFVKTIAVTSQGDALRLEHRLDPGPGAPDEYAAWAITQFPLGGVAIIPLGPTIEAPGSQASRNLVLWPYTDLSDPRLTFRADAVILSATSAGAIKLGAGHDPGCLGYLHGGKLFTKRFEAHPAVPYPDLGAVGQVFANEDFLELESLAPLVSSGPSTHTEIWQIADCTTIEDAVEIVAGAPAE